MPSGVVAVFVVAIVVVAIVAVAIISVAKFVVAIVVVAIIVGASLRQGRHCPVFFFGTVWNENNQGVLLRAFFEFENSYALNFSSYCCCFC